MKYLIVTSPSYDYMYKSITLTVSCEQCDKWWENCICSRHQLALKNLISRILTAPNSTHEIAVISWPTPIQCNPMHGRTEPTSNCASTLQYNTDSMTNGQQLSHIAAEPQKLHGLLQFTAINYINYNTTSRNERDRTEIAKCFNRRSFNRLTSCRKWQHPTRTVCNEWAIHPSSSMTAPLCRNMHAKVDRHLSAPWKHRVRQKNSRTALKRIYLRIPKLYLLE